jgi:hypothetical protein
MTGRIAILIVILLGASTAMAQQPTVTLELVPNGILDGRRAQLYITVESPQELSNAVLDIHASTDFSVDPSTVELPSLARSAILNVTVTRVNGKLLQGDQALTVTLSQGSDAATRKILVSKLAKFTYTPEIPLYSYFFFALIGVAIGYWVRLVVRVLGTVEPPPAAPQQPDATQPGPITRFVKAHYYMVDFLVTVILGFLVLATFVQSGRPPQSGAAWYGALASGVGIGLFTNSELLTRLRR